MWTALIPIFGNLLDKFLPDPKAAAEAKLELLRMAQTGELAELDAFKQISLAQLEVNKADAMGNSAMQRLWRPMMGWACGVALTYQWIGWPMLAWVSSMYGIEAPPKMETEQQFWIIGQMLGLAGMRTMEKMKAAA
jgi:hypothetical protein